jgi:hypothetical protein
MNSTENIFWCLAHMKNSNEYSNDDNNGGGQPSVTFDNLQRQPTNSAAKNELCEKVYSRGRLSTMG